MVKYISEIIYCCRRDRGRLDCIFRRFLYKKDADGTPAFPAKIFFSNSLKFKI
ncbi:MAG: hypothetical protein LBE18_06680 [Planctomycetaceae bacterium]|nr:hypothetical protein [Planctomycetaceae bacterium]